MPQFDAVSDIPGLGYPTVFEDQTHEVRRDNNDKRSIAEQYKRRVRRPNLEPLGQGDAWTG